MLSHQDKPAKWLEWIVLLGLFLAVILPRGLDLTRYVVLNPVRASMVEEPGRWQWSSYQA